MSKVEFTLDGLAVCYHKEGRNYWNIVFPCNQEHTVKFSYTKGGVVFDRPSLIKKNITISAPNSTTPHSYQEQSFTDHVIDATGNYLNYEGLKKIKAPQIDETAMTIQNAVLYTKDEWLRKNRLVLAVPMHAPANTKIMNTDFAMRIGGKIELLPQGKVVISGAEQNPIELFAGDSFRIDNHCEDGCGVNDFDLYRKLYSNKDNAKAYTVFSLALPEVAEILIDDVGLLVKTARPPAFCDPIGVSNPIDL